MASPTKHPKTGTYRVRKAIPKHLQATTEALYGRRAELIESLGTKDAKQARALAPAAMARLQAMMDEAVRVARGSEPRWITEQQVQALAGIFYKRAVEEHGADPGDAGGWEAELDRLEELTEQDPEAPYSIQPSKHEMDPARELLREHGLPLDSATVERVAEAIFSARVNVANLMIRRVGGDWRPDKAALRFPPLPAPEAAPVAIPTVIFEALLQGFAADKGWGRLEDTPISRALYDRKRTLTRLAAFLGHDDALRVSKADAVRWKEDMQARGLHPSTVRNDLSECSAVWRWAIRNAKLHADGTHSRALRPLRLPSAAPTSAPSRKPRRRRSCLQLERARACFGGSHGSAA